MPAERKRAVRLFRQFAPVSVGDYLAAKAAAQRVAPQVLHVVPHGQHYLVGGQPLFNQVEREHIRHFAHDQPRFLAIVGGVQHLPRAHALALGNVGFHVGDGARLPAPRVVDKQLGIDPEKAVEVLLVRQRKPRDVAHRVQPDRLQLFRVAAPQPPKIGERAVVPKQAAVAALVQLGYAHTVGVGGHMLGNNIHRDLAKVHICSDAGGCGNARFAQHIAYHFHRQFVRRAAVDREVARSVDEDLVDRVDENVRRRNVAQVDLEYLRADRHVARHLRRGGDVAKLERGVGGDLGVDERTAAEFFDFCRTFPQRVDLRNTLDDLEKPRPPAYTVRFQRGRHRQTDSFFSSAAVCDNEVGGHRVQPAGNAFHARVKTFQVDSNVNSVNILHNTQKSVKYLYEQMFSKTIIAHMFAFVKCFLQKKSSRSVIGTEFT